MSTATATPIVYTACEGAANQIRRVKLAGVDVTNRARSVEYDGTNVTRLEMYRVDARGNLTADASWADAQGCAEVLIDCPCGGTYTLGLTSCPKCKATRPV